MMPITKDEQMALSAGIQAYLLMHALIASLKESKVISDRQALRIIEVAQRKAGMLRDAAPTTALTMAVLALNQQVGSARKKLEPLH
jgi:hypothetical protein